MLASGDSGSSYTPNPKSVPAFWRRIGGCSVVIVFLIIAANIYRIEWIERSEREWLEEMTAIEPPLGEDTVEDLCNRLRLTHHEICSFSRPVFASEFVDQIEKIAERRRLDTFDEWDALLGPYGGCTRAFNYGEMRLFHCTYRFQEGGVNSIRIAFYETGFAQDIRYRTVVAGSE